MLPSDNPDASPALVAPIDAAEGPLARIPKAPRVLSAAAEALLKEQDAKDKSSVVLGWVALVLSPSVLFLPFKTQNDTPAAKLLLVAPFVVVGIVLLVSGYRALRARRPTFASGTPTLATVTAFQQDRGVTSILWKFTDELGVSFKGSLSTRQAGLLGERLFAPGSHLVVLYDPANPKRSLMWLD